MKILIALLIFFLLNTQQNVSAQNVSDSTIIQNYFNFAELNSPKLFIQVDKNKISKKEKVWFKIYVRGKENRPYLNPINVYLKAFTEDGRFIKGKAYLSQDGKISGEIDIPKKITSKIIFLYATLDITSSTIKPNDDIEIITVLYNDKIQYKKVPNHKREKSISLKPEGGNVIVGKNNFLFRVTDKYGKEIRIDNASIINQKGDTILSNISCDDYGSCKFNLVVNLHDKYQLLVQPTEGKNLQLYLPKVDTNKEVGIIVNNILKDRVLISLSTSKINKSNFYVIIHTEGKILKKKLNFSDSTTKELNFDRSDLFPGVNTISILNEAHQLIGQRLFFNYWFSEKYKNNIIIETSKIINDSITIKLVDTSSVKRKGTFNFMVTPKESKINFTSLVKKVIFKDYMEGGFDVLKWNNIIPNRKELFQIDNLLILYGHSHIDWKKILNTNVKEEKDKINIGFNISGNALNINNENKDNLFLFQQSSKTIKYADEIRKKDFMFENVYLNANDSIHISLVDKKGRLRKPIIKNFKVSPHFSMDDSLSINKNLFYDVQSSDYEQLDDEVNLIIEENTILLDEVVLNSKKKNQLVVNPSLLNGMFEGVKVSDSITKKYIKLSNLLRKLGFKIKINPLDGRMNIGPKILMNSPPIIILDGFEITENLKDFYLHNVDEVYYEHQGVNKSNGGTIYIYRFNGKRDNPEKKITSTVMPIIGFSNFKRFVTPIYDKKSKAFTSYGIIFWSPELKFNEDGIAFIKIPNYEVSNLKIIIEGFYQDGNIISKEYYEKFK
ncbi:hypothetical protein JM658_16135 [Joostella atrarenae]|uniref:MG2 domain-containing protein n=1 Tax=Joostella atrarenae TaxID=679257 RepID=A0ABS9J7H8_9FLAO|nr:hypothetical protein [Joostella atrarenae]MCF8716360.1 hypothetical protein [Joostella atrarenae]